MVENLLESSDEFSRKKANKKIKVVPGWNDECKDLHKLARVSFLEWRSAGKPVSGALIEDMKNTRSDFKHALENCRLNENELRNEKMKQCFSSKNKSAFWRELRSNKAPKKFSEIDNKRGDENIANIFKTKYETIYNDTNSKRVPINFESKVNSHYQSTHYSYANISSEEIVSAIQRLNPGISHDKIHSNHFKFCSPEVVEFLMNFYNAIIAHSFIPASLLVGLIKPRVKNKFGRLNDSTNYRPVMTSSVIFKCLELCLEPRLLSHIKLNTSQFGFRPGTSTSIAVCLLKETVRYYNRNGSDVFAVFLDLKSAFDKLNHKKLLLKMMEAKIPAYLIGFVKAMYTDQTANVLINTSKSESFPLLNGVRQGAILSPLLFNFYIDSILNEMKKLKVGCRLDFEMCNAFAYADDVVLLGPSYSSVQLMLKVIDNAFKEVDLLLNINKCKTLIFHSRKRSAYPPLRVEGGEIEYVETFKYLGIIFNQNLTNKDDLRRAEKAHLRQFFPIFRKYKSYDDNIKIFIYKTYCNNLFGSELWDEFRGAKLALKSFKVTYHKCMKLMIGLPRWAGNHDTCDKFGLLTLTHRISFELFKFIFRIKGSNSICLSPFKKFLLEKSSIIKNGYKIANEMYGIRDLLDNDISAIYARLCNVQATEERSHYYTGEPNGDCNQN